MARVIRYSFAKTISIAKRTAKYYDARQEATMPEDTEQQTAEESAHELAMRKAKELDRQANPEADPDTNQS
jgi:hypothetical protein